MGLRFSTDEEKKEFNLFVMRDARAHQKEYLEEPLGEIIDAAGKYISNELIPGEKGKPIELRMIPPSFESKSGAFMAWMIAEKGMSVEDAAKQFDDGQPGTAELFQEFGQFVAEHSIVLGTDGTFNTFVFPHTFEGPDKSLKMKEIFIKAALKLDEYKAMDIDYANPEEVKKHASEFVMVNNLCKEIDNQLSDFSGLPYKFPKEEADVANKLGSYIVRKKMKDATLLYEELVANGKTKSDIAADLRDKADKAAALYNNLNRCYDYTPTIDTPGKIYAMRKLLNQQRGKVVVDNEPAYDNMSKRAYDIGLIMELEYEVTDNRLLANIRGEEDPKLDEVFEECNEKYGFTLKSKARALIKDKDRNAERRSKFIKEQKPDNLDEEFKTQGELKADIIRDKVDEILKNAKQLQLKEEDVRLLKKLSDELHAYSNVYREANKKEEFKMFERDKVIKDSYRPMIYLTTGETPTRVNTYQSLLDGISAMKAIHDTYGFGGKDSGEGETVEDPIPPQVQEVLNQVDKMCEAESHFIDCFRELSVGYKSLPQIKKIYTRNNPDIKIQNMKMAEEIQKKKPTTMAQLDEIDAAVAPKAKEKDMQTTLNIDFNVNVLKYIDGIKKEAKLKGELSYDQLINILAARAAISAERNKVGRLNKEVSSIAISETADKLKDMHLLKNFHDNCKTNPEMMKTLMSKLSGGHGGAVEDMIKKHSNYVPLRKLNGDATLLERFVSTPKERINTLQDEYAKNGGNRLHEVTEIMVLRNVAEATRKDSTNLKKPFTADMISEARRQEAVLRKEAKVSQIIYELTEDKFIELITRGNGGKLVEHMRRIADTDRFGKMPGTTEIFEKNTIVGKYKEINKEIKACEKVTLDYYKNLKSGKITKDDLHKQLNDYFPELVAKSIVASQMLADAKNTKTQGDLRIDMNQKDFKNKVEALKKNEDFQKNYKTMMEPDNVPKDFSIKNINEKYKKVEEAQKEAARKAAELEAKKAAEKAQKKQFEKQLADRLKNNKPLGPTGP